MTKNKYNLRNKDEQPKHHHIKEKTQKKYNQPIPDSDDDDSDDDVYETEEEYETEEDEYETEEDEYETGEKNDEMDDKKTNTSFSSSSDDDESKKNNEKYSKNKKNNNHHPKKQTNKQIKNKISPSTTKHKHHKKKPLASSSSSSSSKKRHFKDKQEEEEEDDEEDDDEKNKDDDEDDGEKWKKYIREKYKDVGKHRHSNRHAADDESCDSDEEDIIESGSDEENDDKKGKKMADDEYNKLKRDFNIIFTTGAYKYDDYDDEDGENYDEINYKIIEKTEKYDSEDEEIFMKDNYVKILNLEKEKKQNHPTNPPTKTTNKKKMKKQDKEKDEHNEHNAPDMELIKKINVSVEKEYMELVDLKKKLSEKLQMYPNSKYYFNSLNNCKEEIKNLVNKTRIDNTKNYYKLTRHDKKTTCEMDYFKKKLSNKEQVKIMNELKEINEYIHVDKPYRLRLLELDIPAKYKATVMQKLNVLRSMEPGDPEYYKIKNWIDTFMRIPFHHYKELSIKMSDGINICSSFMENSKKILDDCVYGLNDAKMQILQMIGQWIANPNAIGTAIAIHGPPGTGKTAIIKDGISKILGREFAFIALGGAGDASFLEGHSYTYEGSSWGKIVQILIDSKCMNPVIFFDELDKISETPRGEEIAHILTHLTDTTQNNQYHDKYFSEIDFDLSKCLFVFSYNDETKVNPILKDRMYRIKTKGYETKEKMIIANKYLLPKIRKQVNFSDEDIILPDETLQYIISDKRFSQGEAGVRNLKRCLEIIFTKLNLYRLVDKNSHFLEKELNLEITFPHTVSKTDVDALIKQEETINQSLLSMYV